MLWRITAAITAVYCLHGAEASRQDVAHLAAEVVQEAPRAVAAACLGQTGIGNADLCQTIIRHGAGTALRMRPAPGEHAPRAAGLKAAPIPVNVEAFPLPPMRPALPPSRSGS
jgi:hypothetical protein